MILTLVFIYHFIVVAKISMVIEKIIKTTMPPHLHTHFNETTTWKMREWSWKWSWFNGPFHLSRKSKYSTVERANLQSLFTSAFIHFGKCNNNNKQLQQQPSTKYALLNESIRFIMQFTVVMPWKELMSLTLTSEARCIEPNHFIFVECRFFGFSDFNDNQTRKLFV